MKLRIVAGCVVAASVFHGSAQACWEEVGAMYQVNPYVLAAIAKTESKFDAK